MEESDDDLVSFILLVGTELVLIVVDVVGVVDEVSFVSSGVEISSVVVVVDAVEGSVPSDAKTELLN